MRTNKRCIHRKVLVSRHSMFIEIIAEIIYFGMKSNKLIIMI